MRVLLQCGRCISATCRAVHSTRPGTGKEQKAVFRGPAIFPLTLRGRWAQPCSVFIVVTVGISPTVLPHSQMFTSLNSGKPFLLFPWLKKSRDTNIDFDNVGIL